MLPVKPEEVAFKGRLQPGQMFLVDTVAGRVIPDEELKRTLADRRPYAKWIKENQVTLDMLPDPPRWHPTDLDSILQRQRAFGYTDEDLKFMLGPMAVQGQEPVGSMGCDTPLACLSDKPQPLFNYFKQLFAQVTNPPIDPIREELVMSLASFIGTERNILDETPQHCHTLKLEHPILTNYDLEKLRRVSWGDFLATTLPTLFRVDGGEKELERALDGLCRRASLAIKSGYTLLILSDRGVDDEYAAIPSLLALTAVHNHLVREKSRTQVALIVESGEPREVMHFALLIGYGASAINPYLAIETLEDIHHRGMFADGVTFEAALKNYKKSINKGLLKVFSKMGISTLQSYRGAQIFEAIGLNKSVVEKYFTGTASRVEGIGLDVIAREAKIKHDFAFRPLTESDNELETGGNIQYRANGEYHMFNPLTISKLQHSVRGDSYETYKEFAAAVNDQARHLCTLRGLMNFRFSRRAGSARRGGAGERDREAVHHGRDVFRVDLEGSARDAGHRHEPDRRAVEHGRGRGRRGTLQGQPAQRHQAGGLGPFRRDRELPGERGRVADQSRAGRQARRGRAASGTQGGRDGGSHPAFHRRAWGSSRRRRTTISIRSRTWRSSSTT